MLTYRLLLENVVQFPSPSAATPVAPPEWHEFLEEFGFAYNGPIGLTPPNAGEVTSAEGHEYARKDCYVEIVAYEGGVVAFYVKNYGLFGPKGKINRTEAGGLSLDDLRAAFTKLGVKPKPKGKPRPRARWLKARLTSLGFADKGQDGWMLGDCAIVFFVISATDDTIHGAAAFQGEDMIGIDNHPSGESLERLVQKVIRQARK